MGEAEWIKPENRILIRSDFYFYGEAASAELADIIASDIANHWNEPGGIVYLRNNPCRVEFIVRGFYEKELNPESVWYNTDPRANYFRIEAFSPVHVSFVDGIQCNTGYFKLDNLLNHSTTAAHEYGHTLGLDHPDIMDIRGQGRPGIMYPRGTLCDPGFQYDPLALPLGPGGTMDPRHRVVLPEDIDHLRLHRLSWNEKGFAVVGDFSSVYHEKAEQPQ
jgi:hypothetical protein